MVMKFQQKRTFLKLALRQQLAVLLLCECLSQVISVGVLFKGTRNGWVKSASGSPALGSSDSHHSRPSLCSFLPRKQAQDRDTDPQAWSDLHTSACDLVVLPSWAGVLRRASGEGWAVLA